MKRPPSPQFPGVLRPSESFESVGTELRTGPLFVDVDLSAARSGASALVIPIVGNVLYVDARPNTGTASVVLYDESITAGPARVTLQAGFLCKIPFRSIAIENTAQPGAVMRLIYGVDLEFVPGTGGSVSVVNQPAVTLLNGSITALNGRAGLHSQQSIPVWEGAELGAGSITSTSGPLFGATHNSTVLLAASGVETIWAPAANVNGAIVQTAEWWASIGTVSTTLHGAFIAHTASPTALNQGQALATQSYHINSAGVLVGSGRIQNRVRLAAGLGLYFFAQNLESAAHRSVRYHLY